ncbi:MAG: hypothetical protein DHS20C20_33630 [Ardenticatenaceae bacterium]|nr:MAG: hypothetical protein DHS20C20_33630 [Ardenticatenaceae bacterium]
MNGKVLSGPAAVLIIVLFFLPWIVISCDGTAVGEFSGYNLAASVSPDGGEDIFAQSEISGDPILFAIPLAGVVTLILLAITLGKPSFETNAGWGQIIAAFIALLVLLLEWLQFRGESNGLFEMMIQPALWGTLACLLAIGIGAVFDLVRLHRRPFPLPPPQKKEKRAFRPTLIASREKFNEDADFDNKTILDDELIGADNFGSQADSGATILDDDFAYGHESNATILDDDLLAGEAAYGSYTELGDEFKGFDEPVVTPTPAQPDSFAPPPQGHNIAKTEVLHYQAEIDAWLEFGSGARLGEKFRLHPITSIGRDVKNDIVIEDTALSASHARIMSENGRFFIVDQNSTNGVFIFDARTNRWEKQDSYELQDGTEIKIGRTVLHFKRSN